VRILAEWSRVGGTLIVNCERVPSGGPLTLTVKDMPEEQVLEILLRAAGGYVAVARSAAAVAPQSGASRFERIVILPSGTPGREAVRTAAPPGPVYPQPPMPVYPVLTPSGAERVIGADGQPVADDQEDAPAARPLVGSMPPGFSPPPDAPPNQPAPVTPSATPSVPGGTPRPGMIIPPPAPRRPGV
jgi:hypothetical protein